MEGGPRKERSMGGVLYIFVSHVFVLYEHASIVNGLAGDTRAIITLQGVITDYISSSYVLSR